MNICNGVYPTLLTAPAWYWVLMDAMCPKTVPFRSGYADYRWEVYEDVQTFVPFAVVNTYPTVVFGYANPSAPTVNLWTTVTLGTYNPQISEEAVQSMFNFSEVNTGMLQRAPYSATKFSKDISAFAAVGSLYGGSNTTTGGLALEIFSESFVDCPILSKFSSKDERGLRGSAHISRNSGSPYYVVPRMMEMTSDQLMKNKTPPIYKFYDFDEFFEVLSLTLAKAMELSMVPVPSCPLSPLEVQILLRQTMISHFANLMGQDLYMPPTLLRAMSVGSNGYSETAQSSGMKLPQLLAENIRACGRSLTNLSGGSTMYQLDMVPLLARYSLEGQLGNYLTASGQPVYSVVPGEASIDLINMNAFAGGGPVYVDANGHRFSELVGQFNQWITSMAGSLSPLTSPGDEEGISALSTIYSTLHLLPKPFLASSLPVQQVGAGSDLALKSRAMPVSPGFSSFRSCSAVTSTYHYHSSIYKFHKMMILPTHAIEPSSQFDSVSAYQVNQSEPFKISASSFSPQGDFDPEGETLLTRHMIMADADVRTWLAPPSEMQIELDTLTKLGRGGFFAEIAQSFEGGLPGLPGVPRNYFDRFAH